MVVGVGLEVEVPMAAQVEQDGLLLALLLAEQRLVNCRPDCVRALRRWDDRFRVCKLQCCLKHRDLVVCPRLNEFVVVELRHEWRVAMVPEPSSVDAWRHEVVPEGVHGEVRGESCDIAEVIPELSFGKCGTGRRLDSDHAEVLAVDLVVQERETDSSEVASSTAASDNNIRIIAGKLELLLGLEPDHGLVQTDVV